MSNDSESKESVSFSVYYPFVGHDEDAEPIVNTLNSNPKISILGVLDGMGGAGTTKHTIDGIAHTSAYLGSRKSSEYIQKFISDNIEDFFNNDISVSDISSRMTQDVFNSLTEFEKEHNLRNDIGGVRSKFKRLLPCTVSILVCRDNGNDVDVSVIWAGDSHSYILNPNEGLSQLNIDDLSPPNDAMENLSNDAPMSNSIHLTLSKSETPTFELHVKRYKFSKPCVLLCATDGCFGYLDSPMHFEEILLSTFIDCDRKSIALSDLGKLTELNLLKRSRGKDDISLAAMVYVGDPDKLTQKELALMFNERYNYLQTLLYDDNISTLYQNIPSELEKNKQNYLELLKKRDLISREIENIQDKVYKKIWNESYKSSYEKYISHGENNDN